jgi:hypothetical protein
MKHPFSQAFETSPELAVIAEHANAVGVLCMYWSVLEVTVSDLIRELSSSDETTTAAMLSSARDIGQRCEVAKRLAYIKQPSKKWAEWTRHLIGILDLIQNVLAPKRNRYVHDDWGLLDGKMSQFDRRLKILKPQSRMADCVITVTPRTSLPYDIWHLGVTVMTCIATLREMSETLHLHRQSRRTPKLHGPIVQLCELNPQWRHQAQKPDKPLPPQSSSE